MNNTPRPGENMIYVTGDLRSDRYDLVWVYIGRIGGWERMMKDGKQLHVSYYPLLEIWPFPEEDEPYNQPENKKLKILDGLRENIAQVIFWGIVFGLVLGSIIVAENL